MHAQHVLSNPSGKRDSSGGLAVYNCVVRPALKLQQTRGCNIQLSVKTPLTYIVHIIYMFLYRKITRFTYKKKTILIFCINKRDPGRIARLKVV